MDDITFVRSHWWLVSEGFSLSTANSNVQKLPATLYHAYCRFPRLCRLKCVKSSPHAHPQGHRHSPRQGEIARQAAQAVRRTAAGTLPHACHGRVFHQRSRRALLSLKTNRLPHTQPVPFPLAYDPAPYRNRPEIRHFRSPIPDSFSPGCRESRCLFRHPSIRRRCQRFRQ